MKNLFVLCLAIFFYCSNVAAQDGRYNALLEQSATWRVGMASCGWYITDLRVTEEDSLINGQIYHRIEEIETYSETLIQVYYLREDVNSKKVFHYHEGLQTEFLLYDFGVQIGDTFDLETTLTWQDIVVSLPHVVNNIDEVQLENGEWRKRIQLTRLATTITTPNSAWDLPETFQYSWIEGVGCDSLRMVNYFPDAWQSLLFCHQREGQVMIENNFWGNFCEDFATEPEIELAIEENNAEIVIENIVNVSPNPSNNAWKITDKQSTNTEKTLFLYDTKGQLLNTFSLKNTAIQIPNEHLPTGIYFLNVTQTGKSLGSLKLQKQ